MGSLLMYRLSCFEHTNSGCDNKKYNTFKIKHSIITIVIFVVNNNNVLLYNITITTFVVLNYYI